MVNVLDSKSSARKGLWVQVPPPAQSIVWWLSVDIYKTYDANWKINNCSTP